MSLHAQDVPNAANFLPSPPSSQSYKFKNDSAQYELSKELRTTARGEKARSDMSWQLNTYLSNFSEIMGVELSVKNTPNIYELCNYGMTQATKSIEASQAARFSWRPYARFGEASLITSSEEQYRSTSSYPSAQAVYGWLLGILLSEVNSDRQDQLLKRAYDMGYSSVIAGYNWQSDTEIGRDLASAVLANIHSHNGFLSLVRYAQAEFNKKAGTRASDDPFLYANALPDPTKYLPDPPAEGTAQYEYDVKTYNESKTYRDTSRGDMAVSDADASLENMIRIFSPLLGVTISSSNTPEIYTLLSRIFPVATQSSSEAKEHYNRRRPYVVFDEHTGYPAEEDELRNNGAYPSGHSLLGWLVGLTLSEINPANMESIMSRAYEFGQSRVILGYHWQSDVTTGRYVAGAAFGRLHLESDFLNQLERAIKEFKSTSAIHDAVATSEESEASAPVYTLEGHRLDSRPTRPGIYIRRGKKMIIR